MMKKMEINKILKEGQEILKKANIDIKEARLLLSLAMNISLTDLISKKECTEYEYKLFLEYVSKRANHTPFAYISNKKEFMKLNFVVNENVLIPREDTEILVQNVIQYANTLNKDNIKILDLCTGSGAIAISFAKYINNVNVVASDISELALNVAKENAIINDVKVTFIHSDLFKDIALQKFDIIVSNPPYIKKNDLDNLQEEVKKEPQLALDGGEDGLDYYRIIINHSKEYLECNGLLALEIGFDEAEDIKKLMQDNSYKNIEIIKDLSNNDRVVLGKV